MIPRKTINSLLVFILCTTEAHMMSFSVALENFDEQFHTTAQEEYSGLDRALFFDSTILKQPPLMRKLLNEDGYNFSTITSDGVTIHGTLFNHQSTTLLVVGPGFPTPRERMAPFLALFRNYDVVLFDYRGQGLDQNPSSLLGAATYNCFSVDMLTTCLGTKEALDVLAIVQAVKTKKNYANVYGVGLCYSSFIFAQAAAQQPDLFDKLILDGCWPSLVKVIKHIAANPSLVCSKHPPSSPWPSLTHSNWFLDTTSSLVGWLTQIDLEQLPTIDHYLQQCTMPILFFQCNNDCYCSKEEFEQLLQATGSEKKACITTNNIHGQNYQKDKHAYALISNYFFDEDFFAFKKWLTTHQKPT